LVQHLNFLIATIPYDHWNAGTESIFTVLTYLTFTLTGADVFTKVHNSGGRWDLKVKTDKNIYKMELKLDGTAGEALAQIVSKGYLQLHLADPRKKLAVGISFSSKTREVAKYVVEEQ